MSKLAIWVGVAAVAIAVLLYLLPGRWSVPTLIGDQERRIAEFEKEAAGLKDRLEKAGIEREQFKKQSSEWRNRAIASEARAGTFAARATAIEEELRGLRINRKPPVKTPEEAILVLRELGWLL